MRFGGVVLVRTAVANVRANNDQRRPGRLGFRGIDRAIERGEIVYVRDVLNVPAVRLEARSRLVTEGQRGVALDGDVVVVVKPDQLAEFGVTRKRR